MTRRTISRRGRSRGSRTFNDEQDLLNRIKTGRKTVGGSGLPPWIDPIAAENLIKNGWFNPQIPSGQADFTFLFDIIPYIAGLYDPLSPKGRKTHTCQCYIHENVGPRNLSFLCRDAHVNKVLLKEAAAEAREITWGDDEEQEGCEVCKEREIMRVKGADYDELKPYYQKKRNLYNIRSLISREDMNLVKPWNLSFHYIEKSLLKMAQETYRPDEAELQPFINFSSVTEDGKSIKVTLGSKTIPGKKGEKPIPIPAYDALSFKDRRKAIEKSIVRQAICLDELLLIPSAQEVYDAFHAKSSSSSSGDRKNHFKNGSPDWAEKLIEDFDDLDDLESDIEDKTERELKKFVLDYKIPIDLDDLDDMDRDEVAEEILSECEDAFPDDDDADDDDKNQGSGGSSSRSNNACPYGHRFGVDTNEEDECEKCPTETWTACLKESS